MFDDSVQVRCRRCKGVFRERARRLQNGYSRQCPTCEVLLFFDEDSQEQTIRRAMQFYIDGAWVDPVVKKSTPVVNPATEEAMYEVALGSKADLDKAVAAAKRAFVTYSQTSREERIALLTKVIEVYKGRMAQ